MDASAALETLDQRFVAIYEAARIRVVEQVKAQTLIVVDDDQLLLYRGSGTPQTYTGLTPPLYNKMKTLGHIPLAIFCFYQAEHGGDLTESEIAAIRQYRQQLAAAADILALDAELSAGIVPRPVQIYPMAMAFLDGACADPQNSRRGLAHFTHGVREDVDLVLAVAARSQLEACDARMMAVRKLLTEAEWQELRVLILGPYMAKQGQIFLQYFARLLKTPMQGDGRLVYFDGDDRSLAFDRLGTTTLDALAGKAIFGSGKRLHRDVLADATELTLRELF